MAGNNSIQLLRGSSGTRKSSSQSLLAGQPFFETDTNKLYIGGSNGTALSSALPINRDYYDVVITNSLEFNAWLKSEDKGESVLILEGNYAFTGNNGLNISNVTHLHGLGKVTISMTGGAEQNIVGILGGALELNDGLVYCNVENINIEVTNSRGKAIGFQNCGCLTNCSAHVTGYGGATGYSMCHGLLDCSANVTSSVSSSTVTGFINCDYLVNCSITQQAGFYGIAHGFDACKLLTNCSALLKGSWVSGTCGATGFHMCDDLTNCSANATGAGPMNTYPYGYGFNNCNRLTNCVGTGNSGKTSTDGGDYGIGFFGCTKLCNCVGTGLSKMSGYGFSNCSSCVNCGGSGSTTSTWNACAHVNADTCPEYS